MQQGRPPRAIHRRIRLGQVTTRRIEQHRLVGKIAFTEWGAARACGVQAIQRRTEHRLAAHPFGEAVECDLPRLGADVSLRHAAITNALDAGVQLRDAQILARHADPRTTEHYDRARGNLDRHGVHFLTAYVAGV